MDILFVTTELAPFIKVGGLADVSAALPKALRLLGHHVTIALPRYPMLEQAGLLAARRLTPLRFSLGDRSYEVTVFDGRLASQVDLVLIDGPGLFDRTGVYGDGTTDYPDNATRVAVFCRAAAEVARQRAAARKPFDVVHINDWPTALVPTYLEQAFTSEDGPAPPTVLTIHNLAHQGVFPKDTMAAMGLGADLFHIDRLEFYGQVNLLKQGIQTASAITTVSPTYAREIQTPELGSKLDGVLAARTLSLTGILNGVDYSVWNPATDPALVARFDAEDFAPKTRCRAALQREVGLPLDSTCPVVASVGRLVHQKGSDVLLNALSKILRGTEAQIIIAGDGDPALCEQFKAAAENSHGRVVFVRAASETLVHRIFGGSDLVVIPSRFEPCGLVQQYAQRYGAVPVARATGGLVDTIVDCDAKLETGSGFLFAEATVDELVGAVERAIAARASENWSRLVRRVMRLDRGWERPARRYEKVYRSVSSPRPEGRTTR